MALLQHKRSMVSRARPALKKRHRTGHASTELGVSSWAWDPALEDRRASMSGEGVLPSEGRREVDRAKEDHDDGDDGPGA